MDRKEANEILKTIIDVGEELIKCGAEIWRVEDTLYRLCNAYGFKKVNIWVILTNIQASVDLDDNDTITMVRYVPSGDYNFDRLDYLNNLSRKACAEKPDSTRLREMLDEVLNRPGQKLWMSYLCRCVAAACFVVVFNGGLMDALVGAVAACIMHFIGIRLKSVEKNPLVFNSIESFIAEMIILGCYAAGICLNYNATTIGIVMLLIGGVGFTNGVREFLNRDILSGGLNMVNAMLGATGIAVGIAMAFLLMKGVM